MRKHAKIFARTQKTTGRNAIPPARNARHANKELQAATPKHSAKLHATSPMPSAMIPLENATLAKEDQTLTALRLNPYVILAALSLIILRLSATPRLENAKNVIQSTLVRDVFQRTNAKTNARRTTHQTCMNASGKLIHQNANHPRPDLTKRKNAMICARSVNMPNVITRTTNALTVKLEKTHCACSPEITAKLCKKEENAKNKNYKDSSECSWSKKAS